MFRLETELDEIEVSEIELEETMSSRSLVLKNLAAGEYGAKGQDSYFVDSQPIPNGITVMPTTTGRSPQGQGHHIGEDHNHEADIESSESGDYSWSGKERLSSHDSWDETGSPVQNSGSGSSSDSGINQSSSRNSSSSNDRWSTDGHSDDTADGLGDSGNYDSDELTGSNQSRGKCHQKSSRSNGDSSSINSSTADSALCSMISSETDSLNSPTVNIEDKFKTLTKKRLNWMSNRHKSHTLSHADFKLFDSSSPDFSCDDDGNVGFGTGEYIKKIRKHSKLTLDVKILETSQRIYRNQKNQLKRSQSCKTVETLV